MAGADGSISPDARSRRIADEGGYPGERLGLPPAGRGSLASWRARFGALLLDWAISTLVAVLIFGSGVLIGSGWYRWMTMTVFLLESAGLTALAGGSAGQLIVRIAVVRLDGRPLGLLQALLRAALVCLVLPAMVVGADRRGLHDTLVGSVVVNRR